MKAIKLLSVFGAALAVMAVAVDPVAAQTSGPIFTNAFGRGIGTGLVLIGAAMGFAKIGSAALESMARQPEKAGAIQTAMIIIGALLEGATFFALIVCMGISVA